MDIVKKIDNILNEDSQFKKGDKVKYKEKEWLILALNYPKMTLISLDGKETVNSFSGHGVERVIDEDFKVGDIIKEKGSNMDKGRRMKITKIDGDDIEGIDFETKKTIYGKKNEFNKVIDEDSESMNFSDETKWSEIAKKKGAKKFIKDPKTGSTFATDDKGNYVGAFDSRAKSGSV